MKQRFIHRKTLQGFSLVEFIISAFVILAVSGIVMTIFTAGLRGINRSTAITAVRQNGDLAMSQIARAIRNAKNFEGVKADGAVDFAPSCYIPPGSPQLVYKAVKVDAFDGGMMQITCPGTGEKALTSTNEGTGQTAPLTDVNRVTVLPESCFFTCRQDSPTDVPTIGISFTVTSNNTGGSLEKDVTQQFQTSVAPRNFIR